MLKLQFVMHLLIVSFSIVENFILDRNSMGSISVYILLFKSDVFMHKVICTSSGPLEVLIEDSDTYFLGFMWPVFHKQNPESGSCATMQYFHLHPQDRLLT